MGRGFAERYPAFVRALAEAADAVADFGGPRVWTPRHGFAHSLDGTANVQPALFVYQMALAELLAHWGVRPDGVIGQGIGEIAAAVVSGALSLTDGAWIAVARSRLLARLDGLGATAVLGATPEETERLVEPLRQRVGIAAVNGPRSVVVSGTEAHIGTLIRRARRRNLFAQRIAVDFAAHGAQVREIAEDLIPLLNGIDPRAPRIPLYSTARRGLVVTSADMDAGYWADNVAATVELGATTAPGRCGRGPDRQSGRPMRLVWVPGDRVDPGPLTDLVFRPGDPAEVRIGLAAVETRRFVPVDQPVEPVEISATGTYVVTGGLGALGAVATRWLLDAGAGEVAVLTRRPRPAPALLDGFEDRIVVVRCDVTDRRDLTNALADIRECGLPIRGLVHSAGALWNAELATVTPDLLASMLEPKLTAATALLELTAADPIDIALLFSSATGALGAPGQAVYAAANAALDAAARESGDRRVISIGWGSWEPGPAAGADGAAHLRRAGIRPFDAARGAEVLAALRGYRDPYVLALDYTPTSDTSSLATRLRTLLPDAPETRPGRSDGALRHPG
jgi:NADP-dependent 3-hydroxy acid dehydrogenase YdfG